ncbi:MAG: FKBP-type peptidyl-prolyl cis-trans isomerase [Pirellulaceae bacterium]|nr:FKBP-type peptidyl-prolyl cis-trans isomerase [Pirellulaceae bacterium]
MTRQRPAHSTDRLKPETMTHSLHHGINCFLLVTAISLCSCSTPMPTEISQPGPVDDDAPTEFTTTQSGLQYRILRKSDGEQPGPTDVVLAHYTGWLDDGTEFDSSYKRGQATAFPLSGVIGGWTEGLQLVGVGGMIELKIPSELGYGQRGVPGTIPPDSPLNFKIELIEIRLKGH